MPIRHAIPEQYPEWRDEWLSQLPHLAALQDGLRNVLDPFSGPWEVLDREVNMSWSRSASEVVTCGGSGGQTLRVLVKYGRDEQGLEVVYEDAVYQHVLHDAELATPRRFGTFPVGGRTALVLEFLADATRLHKSGDADALLTSARAIGRFHATVAPRLTRHEMQFMRHHDASFYQDCAARMDRCTTAARATRPWLGLILERSDLWIPLLLDGPRTVVHGEYYPDNILVRDGIAYTVDWETAAIAAGSVDLACLTSGRWPADLVAACEATYAEARWGRSPTLDPPDALAAARIYLHCRALGESAEAAASDRLSWRYPDLYRDAVAVGLL